MKRFLLLFVLAISHFFYSQTPDFEWVTNLTGPGLNEVYSIETTTEGYVYCLVSYEGGLNLPNYPYFDSNGERDIAVVKLNRYGNFMWGKKFGGIGTETAVRLRLLSNQNILIVGGFQDTVDFDPSVGQEEIRVSNGEDDCFVLILNKDGEYINCKTFGGPQLDIALGIDEDSDHNIWMSGRFKDSIDIDSQGSGTVLYAPNGSGSFLIKMDEQLGVLESISMHASDYAVIYDIDISRQGDIHFTGFFDDTLTVNYADTSFQFFSNGLVDCFYAIIDDVGNYKEHTQIGSNYFEFPNGLTECKDGTYVMQIMYEDSLPLEINNSNQFILGNTFQSTGNTFARNTAIVKLESTNVNWCKTINSIYAGYVLPAAEPAVDEQNNIYLAAHYNGRCTVNQSGFNDIGIHDSKGGLIAKLSPEGEFVGLYTINGAGEMRPWCIYINDSELFVGGSMSGSNDFDLSESTFYPYSSGGVLAKYNLQDPFLFTNEMSEMKTVLHPIPANEILRLDVSNVSGILIHDITGREIQPNYHFDGSTYQINTSELSNGTYILSYTKENSKFTNRFLIQH